jgi:hypothetical protein
MFPPCLLECFRSLVRLVAAEARPLPRPARLAKHRGHPGVLLLASGRVIARLATACIATARQRKPRHSATSGRSGRDSMRRQGFNDTSRARTPLETAIEVSGIEHRGHSARHDDSHKDVSRSWARKPLGKRWFATCYSNLVIEPAPFAVGAAGGAHVGGPSHQSRST